MTATELVPPLVTYNVRWSAESATLLLVLPAIGRPGAKTNSGPALDATLKHQCGQEDDKDDIGSQPVWTLAGVEERQAG